MTTKVLYNNSYGPFEFSSAFEAEYAARAGRNIDTAKRLFHLGTLSIRTDPVAIALREEKGAEWSSGPQSYIEVRAFSSVFEKYWEVEESDGDETVRLLVSEALADVLHAFMGGGDLETLKAQYKRITEAASPSKPTETDATYTGYGYFDSGYTGTPPSDHPEGARGTIHLGSA
jgi:hypothetical protein